MSYILFFTWERAVQNMAPVKQVKESIVRCAIFIKDPLCRYFWKVVWQSYRHKISRQEISHIFFVTFLIIAKILVGIVSAIVVWVFFNENCLCDVNHVVITSIFPSQLDHPHMGRRGPAKRYGFPIGCQDMHHSRVQSDCSVWSWIWWYIWLLYGYELVQWFTLWLVLGQYNLVLLGINGGTESAKGLFACTIYLNNSKVDPQMR